MIEKLLNWFGCGAREAAIDHGHDHAAGQGHTHGVMDATIATTARGIWAIKWSFAILAATAMLQLFIVAISGSVALLADTIHNIGDAGTAIPLWVAFMLARRKPTKTFPYGYGRVEDKGSAIQGEKFDLFFKKHKQALQWGRKKQPVQVYRPAPNLATAQ